MSSIELHLDATAYPLSDASPAYLAAGSENVQARPLYLRKNLMIGCWNVRTLLQTGSQGITLRSLYDYGVDITCLSETRLPESGARRLRVPGVDVDYWLYHSGPSDNSGLHGVGLALSHRAHDALVAWNPVSSRIIMARFRSKPFNLTVIGVYAPTSSHDSPVKDEFYQLLQTTVDNVPRRDILIVAGDWNARVGRQNEFTKSIVGKFTIGDRCDNGERLINFAASNHLVVSNTRFQHPKRHLLTWYSNDGRTAGQIDHILVRARWISSIEDCRAYRGAETGNAGGSDHTLVRAKFKLHLSSRIKKLPPKRLNTAPLNCEQVRMELSESITHQLESNPPTTDISPNSVNLYWKQLKHAVHHASVQHLGYVEHHRKAWITEETIQLSKLATKARLSKSPNYRNLRRLATRSARNDRTAYWDNLAQEMEAASQVGDFGKLFKILRSTTKQHFPQSTLLRDTDGNLIFGHEEKMQRWVEYFSQLLNHPISQTNGLLLEVPNVQYNIDLEAPKHEEIAEVICSLKNKKCPGEDGIPLEIYKYCPSALLDPLYKLFYLIWETETVPLDWCTSILLPIPKKGDRSLCESYRGISLLDSVAKIFATILLRRLKTERDQRTRPNQGGFRTGKGCVDQIFALRRTLEHRAKYQQSTIVCFVDFKAAFDSVHRGSLWEIMLADGVPLKLVNLVRAYYSLVKARVRVYGEETPEFLVETGVKQGCPLSPVLFNFVIDWVLERSIGDHPGVQLTSNTWITDLEYADDVVLLADNVGDMQRVLNRLCENASLVGLQINASKTKFFSSCLDTPHALHLGEAGIEQVSCFNYLGSTFLPNGQAKDEVVHRIDRARVTFMQLRQNLWRRSDISVRTKMRVYNASIRPILIYGCETWPLRTEDVRKLETFDHFCLRSIIGVRRLDKVSNESVRIRCMNNEKLSRLLQRRRLQWFGHVLRMSEGAICREVLAPEPCRGWKCRRGGQVKTWISTIKGDMERFGLQSVYGLRTWNRRWINICGELAADRRAWAAIIRDMSEADSS